MNNYKSFAELKEELGSNYDFKLYEMGISALKEIENLQEQVKKQKEVINKAIECIEKCISSPDIYEQFISTSETKQLLDILRS